MTTHNRFKRKELALLISLSCALAAPATLAQEEVVELETYTAEGQVKL